MIPLSKEEISSWSPESYANLAGAPAFRFRAPTPRDKRRYQHALSVEGLRFYSDETVQAEILRALARLWEGSSEDRAVTEGRFKAFWASLEYARQDPTFVIDADEADAIAEATARLVDAWSPLRRMNADNRRFNDEAPKVALGMFLAGWSNLPVHYRLEDGVVPMEVLDQVEDAMDAIETQAFADNVEGIVPGGLAFMQLALHALDLMGLGKAAEKNSSSPSPSSEDQSGSPMNGRTAARKGRSANSRSKPATTRATTSRKKRAIS